MRKYFLILFLIIACGAMGQSWTPAGSQNMGYTGGDLEVTGDLDVKGRLRAYPSELENQYRFTMAMSWVRGDYESAGIATYTDGPAHGKGTSAFNGSTLMPNGKVMLTPSSSPNIGIYDPVTNTYTDGPAHGKSSEAFSGGTLMPNGQVMLTPDRSVNIGIYDPATDTYTDCPAYGKDSYAFSGGTLMPNGKVMLVPYRSANIGIYDPKLDVSAVIGLANYLRLPFFNKF